VERAQAGGDLLYGVGVRLEEGGRLDSRVHRVRACPVFFLLGMLFFYPDEIDR